MYCIVTVVRFVIILIKFYVCMYVVVPESRVTGATSVPILIFLGLSVLELSPMYATDRRQT